MKRALIAAAALALVFSAGAAWAAMSPDDVSKKLAQQFGVKVLRVVLGEVDGKKVFLATVMRAGGNSNAAFEVSTLAVDMETGALLPAFRHTKSGYVLSDSGATNTNRNAWSVPESGRTWR